MRIRHLIAAVPVALLVLTGCGGSEDSATSATSATTTASEAEVAELEAAVADMCAQVAVFLDNSEAQAVAGGTEFDRAALGRQFLEQMKANTGVWVGSFNAQAEAMGEEPLDPNTATWEDMPEPARDLIERSVEAGIAGSC